MTNTTKPSYYVRPANHVLTDADRYAEKLHAARAEKMRALTAKMDAVPGLAEEQARAEARLIAARARMAAK